MVSETIRYASCRYLQVFALHVWLDYPNLKKEQHRDIISV